MAKYTIKRKDFRLIVKAKLSYGEKINEKELDFFSRKYIRGLLKVDKVKKRSIEYSGPIGISLYERLKKPMNRYDFFFIMEQIVCISQKLKANAMSTNKIIFDVNNVYINETTKEIQFIYLPLEQPQSKVNVIEFMEKIIYSVIPVREQNADYISNFVYFIKSLPSFDAAKVENYILQEERSVVNIIKRNGIGHSGYMTDKQIDYYAHYNKQDEEATTLLKDEKATDLLEDEEATGLLSDNDGTFLLTENKNIKAVTLYRVLTDETISINKKVFRIGKEKNHSDYFVGDNDTISRSHADIIIRENQYYIMDLNSKNKTYVNGQMISAQEEVEIFDGDRLRLANEEFVFHV